MELKNIVMILAMRKYFHLAEYEEVKRELGKDPYSLRKGLTQRFMGERDE